MSYMSTSRRCACGLLQCDPALLGASPFQCVSLCVLCSMCESLCFVFYVLLSRVLPSSSKSDVNNGGQKFNSNDECWSRRLSAALGLITPSVAACVSELFFYRIRPGDALALHPNQSISGQILGAPCASRRAPIYDTARHNPCGAERWSARF